MPMNTRFLVRDLTSIEREIFEERAAIMEFDGLLPRADAEAMAYEEILKRRAAEQILHAANGRKAA